MRVAGSSRRASNTRFWPGSCATSCCTTGLLGARGARSDCTRPGGRNGCSNIEFIKRETFAYSCEAYACIVARAKSPAGFEPDNRATTRWTIRGAESAVAGVAIGEASRQPGPVPPNVDEPLTDDELDLLEERGLGVNYALGVIHAVGVAPGLIPTPQWLPLAFGNAQADQTAIGLVIRLYNQVLGMLSTGREVMTPEAEDEAACVAFASGYVAAATLDPAWVGHTARWTFAAPLAFLADRHDLVPAGFLAEMPDREEARRVALRDLGKVVYATYQSFAKDRLAIAHATHARAATARVGRNEPCPCGSGKKYKRCCIDRPV